TLLSLINDVLDFSKIEAGEMHVEKIPFSLQNIVKHAIDMNSIPIKNKKLMMTMDISPTLPETLLGDPLRIQQILVNLITNAVKFTHHGGISIRLYSEEKRDDKFLLRCDVIDTGIGISEKLSTDLFKSFQQADDSVTRQYGGTGLGLTISQQLCELMGGKIWLHSKEGQGSTFSFTIPVQKAPKNHNPIKKDLEQYNAAPNLSDYKVLVVEDNMINQKVILGYLKDTYIQVDLAENGEEAINKVYAQKYDLVLMDIQMPIMDGLTATQILRQSPNYQKLPIIAMTAHVSEEAKKQSYEVGMNEHLDKPIKKADLYKILQKYLDIKKPENSMPLKAFQHPLQDPFYIQALSNLNAIGTLDSRYAINNLDGKQDLYIELVSAFFIKYQDFSIENNNSIKSIIISLKSDALSIGALSLSSQCIVLEKKYSDRIIDDSECINLEQSINELLQEIQSALDEYLSHKEEKNEFCVNELSRTLESIIPLLNKSDFFVENHFPLLRQMVKETVYALDIEHLIYNIKNVEFEVAEIHASQLILAFQGNSYNGHKTKSLSH
ncbi:ATP-binding protein, partial [Marinomonas sp.]